MSVTWATILCVCLICGPVLIIAIRDETARRRHLYALALHAERRLQDAAAEKLWPGQDRGRWPDCTGMPCDFEDGWTCRTHCRKCRPLSPCVAHDDAFWAVIGEGRTTP